MSRVPRSRRIIPALSLLAVLLPLVVALNPPEAEATSDFCIRRSRPDCEVENLADTVEIRVSSTPVDGGDEISLRAFNTAVCEDGPGGMPSNFPCANSDGVRVGLWLADIETGATRNQPLCCHTNSTFTIRDSDRFLEQFDGPTIEFDVAVFWVQNFLRTGEGNEQVEVVRLEDVRLSPAGALDAVVSLPGGTSVAIGQPFEVQVTVSVGSAATQAVSGITTDGLTLGDGLELVEPLSSSGPFSLGPGESTAVAGMVRATRAGTTSIISEWMGSGFRSFDQVLVEVDAPSFSWTVPERLERPDPQTIPDMADTPEEIQHETYPVDLHVDRPGFCDGTVTWRADGGDLAATRDADDTCTWRIELAEERAHEIELLVNGTPVGSQRVTPEDLLVVILGDSVASGEGNPDVDDPSGPQWIDDPCHRSFNSAHVESAVRLEEASDTSSVTLVHLACSGASIAEGLLARQTILDNEDPQNPRFIQVEPQLQVVRELVGEREIDRVLLSVGANDVHFGPITSYCATHGSIDAACYQMGVSTTTTFRNSGGIEIATVSIAETLDDHATVPCDSGEVGDTSIVLLSSGDADERYDVTLNALDEDYSDNQPEGPDASNDYELTSEPRPDICNRRPDFSDPAVEFDIERPLEEPHPVLYARATPPGPSLETVYLYPRTTLREDMDDVYLPELQRRIQQVAVPLSALTDPENIFVTEYYDPLTGDDETSCDNALITNPVSALDPQPGDGIDLNEAEWARTKVLAEMNRQLDAEARRQGWQFVGGPGRDFHGHGYCATTPWVHTFSSSAVTGNAFSGPLHPNDVGHDVIADILFAALDEGDLRPLTIWAYTPPSELLERLRAAAREGDSQISTAAPAPRFAGAAPSDLREGQRIVIGTHGEHPEVRTVVSLDPVVLDEPLEHDHPTGTVVTAAPGQEPPRFVEVTVPDGSNHAVVAAELSALAPQLGGPDGAEEVLLASATSFPDALASGALQGSSPLLLTPVDHLASETAAEIQRLAPSRVRILGGEVAVSEAVAAEVAALGVEVVRTAGPTRLETAAAIAELANNDPLVVRAFPAAGGEDTQAFADSLAVGGWAAASSRSILLSQTEVLSTTTAEGLTVANGDRADLVGGTAALGTEVEAAAGALVGDLGRVSGPNRFETAIAIAAARGLAAPDAVIVIDGQSPNGWAAGFPSARLSAGLGAPILLTAGAVLPDPTADILGVLAGRAETVVICAAGPEACSAVRGLLES